MHGFRPDTKKHSELGINKIKNLEDQIKRMKEEDRINWSLVRPERELQEPMSTRRKRRARTQRRRRSVSAKGIGDV